MARGPGLAISWFLARVLGLLFLLGLAAAAQAQDALGCAPDPSVDRMLAAVPRCQKDAMFLATLGQRLNAQGRYLEAADHLERALMLDANLKDAQLSYAIALTGSGDISSAAALLEQMLRDPGMPVTLRALIQQQKAALADVAAASRFTSLAAGDAHAWQGRFTLAARVGYDSNLMGSPNLDSLALTLSGQTLVLALDESYLARGGSYTRADAQFDLQRRAADGSRWDAVASLRSRYSPTLAEAGSTQADLLIERSQSQPGALGTYINASASALESKAGMHYSAASLGAGAVWRGGAESACQARAGAEWQARNYLTNPVLSGRYSGLAGYWSCQQPTGLQWLLGLKTGRDAAQDAARPGGDQSQSSVRLAGYIPLAATGQRGLLWDFEQSQQTDASGYSPIIDDGGTRSVSRRAARLEYQHTLAVGAQWLLGLERVAQSSSLPLFQQDNWGAYSGLRVSW
jgi:tetratricopeptide (TPR) repeat protein